MDRKYILELVNEMSLTEKAMQMTQLVSGLVCHTQVGKLTGPFRAWDFTDEELEMTGSILGSHNADHVISVQDQYLASSKHKIPLMFMEDVIHGFGTIFPIPLAQGCSFDPGLVEEACCATAKEAAAAGVHVTFSPMADLVRDPRWGRVMESPGEDPFLNGEIVAAMVRGYQGDDVAAPDRIASCVKHFAAYGQPEGGREYNTVDMSRGVLRDFYLPAYKAAVDAGAELVMASFNTVERVPATCSEYLLRQILREEWGFKGLVISDFSAVDEIMNHSVAADAYEAGEKCVKAGMDIEMMSGVYAKSIKTLVEEGTLSMADVDECVIRILELKNRLGLFENPYKGANAKLQEKLFCCPEHREIARKLAVESMVLLKNDGVLPLNADCKVGLAGPAAESGNILGGWHCAGRIKEATTLKDGIYNVVGDRLTTAMTNQFVYEVHEDIPDEVDAAVEAFRDCDVCVVAVGEPEWATGEASSRTELRLSPNQEKLIHGLKAAGKKVVTLILSGRPLEILPIVEDSDAILQVWFPGTEGGTAVADILFGKENPSGRLSMSFPRTLGQIPVYYNCYNTGRPNLENGDHFTSRYIDCPNDPLYPFGYGLSYSKFDYSDFQVSVNGAEIKRESVTHDFAKGNMVASVKIKNVSDVAGDVLPQLYIRDISGSVVRPVKELKGYRHIVLQPGEETTVEFEVTRDMLSFYNNDEKFVFETGLFDVMIGNDSANVLTQRIWIS